MKKYFETLAGDRLELPVFFPDATQAVIRTLDSRDVEGSKTPGVLVNTYHLWRTLGDDLHDKGIGKFMGYGGGIISDSGGFQVMSIAKKQSKRAVKDEGVYFKPQGSKKKILFTPEESIKYQIKLKTDMVVVLDDFTPPDASREIAYDTVRRTIDWARRSREEFDWQCEAQKLNKKPYLLAVVQGGRYMDLRKECALALAEIGFDGFGYGGWPINQPGEFDYESAEVIVEHTPENYFLYGLGIGKPEDIVGCSSMGYQIFDCVLPTRDARHKRLYVYKEGTKDKLDTKGEFYEYYIPDKAKHLKEDIPVSSSCDCLLCVNYSRAYLAHLFKIKDSSAMRLATIHNLRFYSSLMEYLRPAGRDFTPTVDS